MFELIRRDKRRVLEPEDVHHFESGYRHMNTADEAMQAAAGQVGELDHDLGDRARELSRQVHTLLIDFRTAFKRAEQEGQH
ncbi:hypothetical protein ACQEVI_19745 [Promicromonospora sp. CA-289599]|uniref:hypothetical protein n=1 Tax=Promicromonospora sp. CA-289599 TaxID=3240014 RepID=UPI003D9114B2